MTLVETYDVIRHANVVLGVVTTLLLLTRVPAWARAPWPTKVGRLVIFGWVTSTTYGTWEALAQAASVGPRVPAVTSMMMLTAYYVAVEWRSDRRQHAQIVAALHRDSPSGP